MRRAIVIILALALFGLGSYFALRRSVSGRLGLGDGNSGINLEAASAATSNEQVSVTQREVSTSPASADPNVPIELWGRILDQDGKPIADAWVTFSVRSWPFIRRHLLLEGRFERGDTVSGFDGVFSIRNYKGDCLTIESITKPGFELATKRHLSFEFQQSGFRSKRENPLIYTMLADSVGVAERLKEFQFNTRISCDGIPTVFDVNGTKQEGELTRGGDIRITLERSPRLVSTGSRDFDWKARIEIVDGGLVLHNSSLRMLEAEEFSMMYLAPEGGYVPSYEIALNRNDPDWAPRKAVSFFFRNRNGQHYGRAVLEIDAAYTEDRTGFFLSGAVNPTGSRKLRPPIRYGSGR